MMAIDLHTHTIYSDGGLEPEELVRKAKEIGLSALAIADHDSVSALEEGLKIAQEVGIELVPALEISSYPDEENEFHILGYFIDWQNSVLVSTLKHFQEVRDKRAHKIAERLNELGYQVSYEEIRKQAKGTIVQPHVAAAVIGNPANEKKLKQEFGVSPKTGDFIREHLIQGKDAYITREALTPKEALDLIHKAGGITSLAHPCWNLVKKDSASGELVFDDAGLKELVKIGLDGIEVYAHRENEADTRACVDHYLKLATELNLVASGGSDFHGYGSAGKKLGFEDFYLKVPDAVLDELKKFKR
ncbi:MAG: PHP domain-containing protein [bacterium]|nr:PHP domain-containing protein [bacterium]